MNHLRQLAKQNERWQRRQLARAMAIIVAALAVVWYLGS